MSNFIDSNPILKTFHYIFLLHPWITLRVLKSFKTQVKEIYRIPLEWPKCTFNFVFYICCVFSSITYEVDKSKESKKKKCLNKEGPLFGDEYQFYWVLKRQHSRIFVFWKKWVNEYPRLFKFIFFWIFKYFEQSKCKEKLRIFWNHSVGEFFCRFLEFSRF